MFRKRRSFYVFFAISIFLLLLCACNTENNKKEPQKNISVSIQLPKQATPAISAQSAILIDAANGSVICEKNAHVRLPMASTTKIMTALVVAENCDLEKTVSVSPDAVGIEGSSIYLYAGERLRAYDLLCAVLLESANDAAAALAIEVGGSVEEFCVLMNKKVAELGLENTHFTNPHGLHDDGHYTSAYDLAIIAAEALKNETVMKIVSTKKITVEPVEGNVRVLRNHNKMLSMYEGAIGVKTGFTKKSGRCLVSAAERGGLTLVAVTLNAPDDWNDHTTLLDLGFENFESVTLAEEGEIFHMLPIMGGNGIYCPLVAKEDLYVTLGKNSVGEVRTVIESSTRYGILPIHKGDKLGDVSFYIRNEKIASCPLIAAEDMAKK